MFLPSKWHMESEPWELMPATEGLAAEVGMALTMSSGKLVKATGSTKPEFICMEKKTAAAGEMLHVERVRPETEYETELSAQFSAMVPGVKVTIATDAERITATTDSGVAEVVNFDGTAAGSKVRVRFS